MYSTVGTEPTENQVGTANYEHQVCASAHWDWEKRVRNLERTRRAESMGSPDPGEVYFTPSIKASRCLSRTHWQDWSGESAKVDCRSGKVSQYSFDEPGKLKRVNIMVSLGQQEAFAPI